MKKSLLSLLAAAAISTSASFAATDDAPAVTMAEVQISATTIDLQFTPNDATSTYHCCLFDQGQFDMQYNMFAGWFGFTCYGDMIRAWGYECVGTQTKTWKDLTPNTTYEIYVQPLDQAGAYGELQCFYVTTTGMGGDGVAEITIEIGAFGGEEDARWQQIIFTPNSETAVFFDLICTEEFFAENGAEGVIDYLKAEDDPTSEAYSYYAQYTQDNDLWSVEDATKYHACAIGKNANGEWGELADVVFTTPGYQEPVSVQKVEGSGFQAGKCYNLQGQALREAMGLMIRDGRKQYLAK